MGFIVQLLVKSMLIKQHGILIITPRMALNPDYTTYLESIVQNEKYQCWSNLYTSTDTVGKQVDMGLMVKSQGEKEKSERLPVL